ncbi:hypothetical protein EKO04_010211 [Ascochyta lentis]|uniref:RING-type domain-containing protein n=1 Tax=Ascochyta lentis TaxID=205686 RepID=A0A8H7ITA4_9PLEO|nr:hypothetical protein EKO04_010211 [Ascochyta lentis]
MAEGERSSGVQGDLEKELTCSICTDLLYQPLTLLDCLHTFCGACLKEWFAFQASAATSIHPYTCPSCRASVRTTQPNATVTTLLEIFLKANPGRGKSEEEKKADKDKYRPGDNVMPKLRRRGEPEDDSERRMVEEVQQLSLREVGIPSGSSNTLELPRERRRHERSREGSRESRRSRDDRRTTSRNTSPSRAVVPPRAIEHQSSLRSLLSASDLGAEDVDEDLVRHVLEELLAEGVDLNDIGTTQEEEITERIAEAVRRRQAERQSERQRERRERRERLARDGLMSSSATSLPQPLRGAPVRDEDTSRRRAHGRSESRTSTPQNGTRHAPPISRPGLMDAANGGGRQHRRSSSQGSSRSARRADRPPALSVSARQSNNEQERPSTSGVVPPPRRRQSDNQQNSTIEARRQFRSSIYDSMNAASPVSPLTTGFNMPSSDSPTSTLATVASPLHSSPSSTPVDTPFRAPSLRRITDPASGRPRVSLTGTPPLVLPPSFLRSTTDPNVNEARSRQASASAPSAPVLYAEPHVSCNSCGKDHIEYELHYNCQRCDSGEYNICLRCFRFGKGCRHWFGFGWAAWLRYERQAPQGGYSPSVDHPHVLTGHRYRRPLAQLTESSTPPHVLMSEHNPEQRMETGVFCDICKAFANACYWKCDYCNEGEWGYCNDCVNQGRHCTHPLLPVAHKSPNETSDSPDVSAPSTPHHNTDTLAPPDHDYEAMTAPLTPKTASLMRGPILFTIANLTFRPLTFTTLCNVCRYPIPPSNTRYHCLKCNAGDYDVCMSCYHKLVVSNRISKENGVNGWRKCFRGHRMVIVGFEDRDGGQLRIVVRDLVGGWALKDDDGQTRSPTSRAPQRYPPDGGSGLKLQARWGYWPEEGVRDELAFPKIAEIREAADVNGEWCWGVYCGMMGLFPASHVAPL